MPEWKDTRKNIYTLVITSARNGDIVHLETHSNKKQAEARYATQFERWVTRDQGGPQEGHFQVTLKITKLQRKHR